MNKRVLEVNHATMRFGGLVGSGLRVQHKVTTQFLAQTFDVFRRNNVWRNNHFTNILIGIDVTHQQILVRLPRTANDQHIAVAGKGFGYGQLPSGSRYVGHAVEACVVANGNML